MKHGARNDIPAPVVAIKRGGVMAQIDAEIMATRFRISSVMTPGSLEGLAIREGDTVRVVAEAVKMLLIKPDQGRPTAGSSPSPP